MKQYMPVILAIILGIFFGNILFDSYEDEKVMSSDGSIYWLQYGAYTKKDVMEENIKNLTKENYIVSIENDIYYVYFGLTTNYQVAENIIQIYKEKNIFLYIKESYIGKSSLIKEINNLDHKIQKADDEEIILNYLKNGLELYQKKL